MQKYIDKRIFNFCIFHLLALITSSYCMEEQTDLYKRLVSDSHIVKQPISTDAMSIGPSQEYAEEQSQPIPQEQPIYAPQKPRGSSKKTTTKKPHQEFTCPYAGCSFRSKFKASLNRHLRLHTGQTYKCPHEGCTHTTSQLCHLKDHIRIMHSGEPKNARYYTTPVPLGAEYTTRTKQK